MAQIPDASDSHKKGHGGEPYYTEKKLWQMLDEGKHHEKERAFVIIMVRLYNNAPFREAEPMERAYKALYDMGDRATMYMIRHFLDTAGIDLSPIPGLIELLGPRLIRIKESEPALESEHDRMTEEELVAALSQPAPEPIAETPTTPSAPVKRVSQKKRRKAEQEAGKAFGGKAPPFMEQSVAAG